MNVENLSKILQKEPSFRFKQANEALYKQFISSWQDLSSFPKTLRDKLDKECPLEIKAELVKSNSSSYKALIELEDKLKIETVLITHDSRQTVCLSSQVGCPLACSFCSTGKLGFKRNLTSYEIIEQFLFWARFLKIKNQKIDNLVFMGMGEPLLNYHELLKSISFLNNEEKFNFAARRISISTVGMIDEIKKLASEPYQVNLAISLNASSDKIRKKIMPIASSKINLEDLFAVVDYYIKKTNRKVMFEYVMLDKINDSKEDAQLLVKLMKKPLYFLNLIKFNPNESNFKASSEKRIAEFSKILIDNNIRLSRRQSYGNDISAACGQLANIN